ncbi:cystatin domain protein (macronuclear) [Tetrahymena thermophila SB210]|uniref:Cystatin domain protein n=1 Tax=Tetrahymena thermophila (strain SB210) TaxID=312017 RepID=Q22CI9_TETTS|nr:cystatin domain protein [Tetrahymena thermophila SB210]EAR83003.1 cystatin domain protein [Tetrahymena thermophila SB210]|eukprot:XP_001030666.1 cystatin domain protein [Tetrahymena thermophila SB210]
MMKYSILLFIFLYINLSQAGLPGGWHEVDLSNPQQQFQQAIQFSKENFVSDCKLENLNSSVQLQNVIKASYQIVAGTNYKIVFKTDHYSESTLTVKVFASLPDNGKVSYSITECF